MNLKDRKEGYMGEFGGGKGFAEMLSKYIIIS